MRKIIFFFLILLIQILYSQDKPIYFAWLTDTHIGGNTGEADLNLSIDDINRMDSLDFIIISGDITEWGSFEQLNLTKKILEKSKIPYYLIPGNHDTKWSESGATTFKTLFKDDRFVFEFEGIKFIGLHQGPRLRMGDGHWAPEDIRWLDSILTKTSNTQPLVFVSHYPIDKSITNWYLVTDRLRNYNVITILCGHGHANKVMNFDGIGGVMGRSNLRAKDKVGGYNIVKIFNDSLFYFVRNPLTEASQLWHKNSFKNIKDNTTEKAPRPDFSINEKNRKIYKKWKISTGYTIANPATVYKNSLFFGDASGKFYSYNVKTGTKNWEFKTNSAVYSTPDAFDKFVVFASTDSFIYCLNIKDGVLVWKYKTQAPLVSCPKISDNVVYIGSSDRNFRAIDLKTGKLIWSFGLVNGFVESVPLITKDKVIFGAWDTHLYCLNRKNGNLIWKWKGTVPGTLLSPAACTPVYANGKVFIVAPDRFATAIDINTGKNIWRTNNFEVRETIGISEDSSKIYVRTMNDTIYAISTIEEQPKVLWYSKLNNGYDINSAQIIEKDNTLFYPTKDGVLFALDAKTGEILWRYRTGIALANTATPLNKHNVIITNFDGEVMLVSNDEENYHKKK